MSHHRGNDGHADEAMPRCSCKVGRTIESYDLPGMNADLAARWTGRGSEKYSLRELERYFNERVLQAALEAAGVDPLNGEVENLYALLTSDDSGEIEARRRLEREGIDVERVTSDFVSHQAIHSHLRDCCDVELEKDTGDPLEKGRDTIASLQNRLTAVTENTLQRLARTGVLSLGDFSVFVSVQITCEECGQYYSITELLDQGGCNCQEDVDDEVGE
ncbi:rod-determining factor RdfA [Natribaculum luteum]|uniref:Rod-determining factor RdfA n=1 Tax=Natribaculum luteum TaxID=1586232 RepID=A0ABD5P268_9EURY|nr:rod-determining factor RdfA [Natribaculum luteum]